jgi:N-acetylmuramoyl-L-alanine amidase
LKIFLDPGHGGSDSGEAANGILEKNVNLSVALKLKPLLLAQGIEVKLSREDDSFPDLNSRPAMANSWGADFFMSIHHNGGGGIGYEIYRSIRPDASLTLAQAIAARYEAIDRKPHNGGVQARQGSDGHDYYAVVRQANMSAILSEYCYLDSSDVNAINSDAGQATEAEAMASGIFAHLGISPVQTPTVTVPPTVKGDPYTLAVQQKINRLRITSLTADGIFGPITRAGVTKFEQIAGITQDGAWGPQCEAAYQAIVSKPMLKQGSTGIAVRYLQFRFGLAIDGQFGPKTDAAVKTFQSSNGLAVDGLFGNLSWTKLIG